MAKDHRKAVHWSLSRGYIGLQLSTPKRPFANGKHRNTVNVGTVLYDQLSFFLRQPYDFIEIHLDQLFRQARSLDICRGAMTAFGASCPLLIAPARSPDRTDSRRSALAAGTALHAPFQPLADAARIRLSMVRMRPFGGCVGDDGAVLIPDPAA
jgi:hypothetical protein